jgi:hypothetical protein
MEMGSNMTTIEKDKLIEAAEGLIETIKIECDLMEAAAVSEEVFTFTDQEGNMYQFSIVVEPYQAFHNETVLG